jgi:hypothetical protein
MERARRRRRPATPPDGSVPVHEDPGAVAEAREVAAVETTGTPEAPEATELPGAPEAPDMPGAPEAPDTSATPEPFPGSALISGEPGEDGATVVAADDTPLRQEPGARRASRGGSRRPGPAAHASPEELLPDGGAPPEHPTEPAGLPLPLVAAAPTAGATSALIDARLAHVHLALGMHGLARAELETLAGAGFLDVPALADLAEVRWRTGDLVGAGEAADAHLQAGGEELVALCVAAEAAGAAGRAADARNLAARALARGRERLDDLFAGQPRSAIWPPQAGTATAAAEPEARGDEQPADGVPGSGVPGLSSDLAEIQGRLAAGELAGIATRLSLVLRVRPVLAPAVLAVADEALQAAPGGPAPPAQEAAALHLVRGDAYRLMGRESLAAEAFQQSSRALRARRLEEKP